MNSQIMEKSTLHGKNIRLYIFIYLLSLFLIFVITAPPS